MKLNIKDKLNEKNMSRYELAKRIGVTYPTITSIYNGDSTSIKLDILESLCRELDCTPNEIIVTEEEELMNNMDIGKLSTKLVPVLIEMMNINPSDKPDFIHYIHENDKEDFEESLNKYLSLLSKIKRGDT